MSDATGVTFVNRFTVHDSPAEFEAVIDKAAEYLRRQDGFVRYTVLRHVPKNGDYLNIALWRDAVSFQRAIAGPEFGALVGALHKLGKSEGDFFETLLVV